MRPLRAYTVILIAGLLTAGPVAAAETAGAKKPTSTSAPATAPARPGRLPSSGPAISVAGSIAIEAVQGTEGGPKIANDVVIVELFRDGEKPEKKELKLDAHGVAMVENLPVLVPFRPRVTVKHAGVAYHATGEPMDATNFHQKITVKVYETTDKEPAWSIRMRHQVIHRMANALRVSEVLSVHNPSDRAWIGQAQAGGERVSITLQLPAGASHIIPGGAFDPCCTKLVDGRVVSVAPLPPGASQFRLLYVVPFKGAALKIDVLTPAPVKHFMVFVPNDGLRCQSDSLTPGGVLNVHQTPMQSFMAQNLPAGRLVSFTLTDSADHGHPPVQARDESSDLPKTLVLVGGGLILVLCVVVFLIRPGKKSKARPT